MANPDENAQSTDAAAPASTFEDSLAELQQIVGELEDGTLGLEESLRRFEQAVILLRRCYQVLEQAEQRIEILTGRDDEGNPATAPFDTSATLAQPNHQRSRQDAPQEPREEDRAVPDDDDSDRRLF